MKILALTTPSPGVRYTAHLRALRDLDIEVVCIYLHGWACTLNALRRHAGILKRRGPLEYARWQRMRHGAQIYRDEVARYIEQALVDEETIRCSMPIRRTFNGFCSAAVKFIEAEKPDFVFQLGAGLLPPKFVRQLPPVLNMHPGILPGIRGVDPLFWAHYYGREDWLGSALHLIDEGIDTGRPLLRRRIKLQQGMHYAESIKQQVFVEMELIKLFFTHYPQGYQRFDQGGCEKSIYRSNWSCEQYERLKQANWWAAEKLG